MQPVQGCAEEDRHQKNHAEIGKANPCIERLRHAQRASDEGKAGLSAFLTRSTPPWVGGIRMVRDSQLDLPSPTDYMLMFDIDYPTSLQDRQRFLDNLSTGMNYRHGDLGVTMSVNDWSRMGEICYPSSAEVVQYGGGSANRAHTWVFVTTRTASLVNQRTIVLPKPAVSTGVDDYRYRKKSKKREFSFAAYTLKPGDEWLPANDPRLLAAAEKHMREAFTFARRMRTPPHYLAWLGFALIFTVPFLLAWRQQRQKNLTTKQNPK